MVTYSNTSEYSGNVVRVRKAGNMFPYIELKIKLSHDPRKFFNWEIPRTKHLKFFDEFLDLEGYLKDTLRKGGNIQIKYVHTVKKRGRLNKERTWLGEIETPDKTIGFETKRFPFSCSRTESAERNIGTL